MFKKLLIAVVAFLLVLAVCQASAQQLQEGWRTNTGVAKSADHRKVAPGYHYDSWTQANQRNRTYFYVSGVKLIWYPGEYPESDWYPDLYPRYPDSKRSVEVPCFNDKTPLWFCVLPEGFKLADVKDPSTLTFREPESQTGKVMRQYIKYYVNGKPVLSKPFELKDGRVPVKSKGNIDTKTIIGTVSVRLFAGQCAVLKVNDDKYIGICPTKINVALRHQAEIGETGPGGTMQYEWRSWTWSVWSDENLRQARNQ